MWTNLGVHKLMAFTALHAHRPLPFCSSVTVVAYCTGAQSRRNHFEESGEKQQDIFNIMAHVESTGTITQASWQKHINIFTNEKIMGDIAQKYRRGPQESQDSQDHPRTQEDKKSVGHGTREIVEDTAYIQIFVNIDGKTK